MMYVIRFDDGSYHYQYGFGWTTKICSEVKIYPSMEDAVCVLDKLIGGTVVPVSQCYAELAHTYVVALSNYQLNKIADECGLVVDTTNRTITVSEIEFFAESVVRECIQTILEQKPEDGSAKIYDDLAESLYQKFGITK